MEKKELNAKFRKLAKLKNKRSELDAEITAIEDELKAYMKANDLTELIGTEHKALWTEYQKSQFDTKGFRANYEELAQMYTKMVTQRKFTFA